MAASASASLRLGEENVSHTNTAETITIIPPTSAITSVTCDTLPLGFNLLSRRQSLAQEVFYRQRGHISRQSCSLGARVRSQFKHPDQVRPHVWV